MTKQQPEQETDWTDRQTDKWCHTDMPTFKDIKKRISTNILKLKMIIQTETE